MGRFRALALAALTVAGFAALAPSAQASTPSAVNKTFCKAVSKISSSVANNAGASSSSKAKALAKSIRKAAKSAPSAVKSALNTLASYFDGVGAAGNNPAKLAAAIKNTGKYSKAVVSFTTYYTKNCSATTPTSSSPVKAGSLDPCTLLAADDASQLAGTTVTQSAGGGPTSGTCVYSASAESLVGAEITVKVEANATAAHADFPQWVQPVPGSTPGFTVTSVSNLGDEASETHTSQIDGIYFRHGAVLVKIGVNPPASDAALQAAAKTVLGRL